MRPSNATAKTAPHPYDAFISYSHKADAELAKVLQYRLEKWARPWFATRTAMLFRDQVSLTATPHLWKTIAESLDSSKHLILLASTDSATSEWVPKEICYWLTEGKCEDPDNLKPEQVINDRVDRLMIVLTEGHIEWSHAAGDFDWSVSSALPRVLSKLPWQPLWTDLRWARGMKAKQLEADERFTEPVLKLLSPIRGKTPQELFDANDKEQRRAVALFRRLSIGLGIAAVLVAITALGFYRQWTVADRERLIAQRRLTGLEAITEGVVFKLYDVIQLLPGAVRHREALIKNALPYLNQLKEEQPTDEPTLRMLAIGYLRLGDVLGHPEEFSLGRTSEAVDTWQLSAEVLDALRTKFPTNRRYQHDKALLLERFALCDLQDGRPTESLEKLQQAFDLMGDVLSSNEDDWTIPRDTAHILMRMGDVQASLHDRPAALDKYNESLELINNTISTHSDIRPLFSDLAAVSIRIAEVDLASGQPDQAIEKISKAIRLRTTLQKDHTYDAVNLVSLANALSLQGDCFRQLLKDQDSKQAYLEAMRTRRLLYDREPENLDFKSNLATELERLGAAYVRLDEMEKAEHAYQESLELRQGIAEVEPNNHEYQYHYAIALERLADIWREHAELTDDERREHVEKPYRRGLEIRNTLALANPQNLLYRRAVGASERRLGQLLIERAGSIPDGLNHLQVAVTLQTKLHEEFPTDFTYARDAAIANFVMADGLIAANENVERIISVQQQGLTLLRNTCQTFPQQMDLLKDLFVAERRVADFLNLKTMDPTSRVEHLTEAIGHYENALRTIEKLKAAGITMVHLDEESKSVTELIAGCRREMIRIDKPQGQ